MAGETRARRAGRRPESTRGVRGRRGLVALVLAAGLLLATAACGNDAQTLRPYTPAEGVNVDVGAGDTLRVVHVRNLLIICATPGTGVLSASIVTDGRDELTGVTGSSFKSDGSPGAAITTKLTDSVTFANGAQIVLTDRAPITLVGADLAPGLTATLTLAFANAGDVTVIAPVVDGAEPQYASISPAATPSA